MNTENPGGAKVWLVCGGAPGRKRKSGPGMMSRILAENISVEKAVGGQGAEREYLSEVPDQAHQRDKMLGASNADIKILEKTLTSQGYVQQK